MRKLLVLLALTAMAALAGACGSPEDEASSTKKEPGRAEKPTAVETVRVAYEETAAEQSARISYETTTTGPENSGQDAPMTMTGNGVTDFSGAASSMTMGMSGMGGLEIRQVGETVYVKMPEELVTQMSGAKPWVRMDLDAVYEQYGGPSQGGAPQDPTRQFEYLRGVSDSVEKVGEELVRGVPTTRYEAIIDLEKEADGQDAGAREASDEMAEKLGTSKLPVEVWIDEENRVRRYALDVSVPMPESGASPDASRDGDEMRTRMVIEYYDFGTPVDVQAPPQDQTMDGSKMFPAQQPATQ